MWSVWGVLSNILSVGLGKILAIMAGLGVMLRLWWVGRKRREAEREARRYKVALEVEKVRTERKEHEKKQFDRIREVMDNGDVDNILAEFDRVRQYAKGKVRTLPSADTSKDN